MCEVNRVGRADVRANCVSAISSSCFRERIRAGASEVKRSRGKEVVFDAARARERARALVYVPLRVHVCVCDTAELALFLSVRNNIYTYIYI